MSIRKDQARTDSTSRPAPGSVPSSTLLAPGKRWRRMELREVKKTKKNQLFVTEISNRLVEGPHGCHNFQEVKNCSLEADQVHPSHPWCCLHQEWWDWQGDIFLNKNKSSMVQWEAFSGFWWSQRMWQSPRLRPALLSLQLPPGWSLRMQTITIWLLGKSQMISMF